MLYRLTLYSHRSLLSRHTADISDNNKHRIFSEVKYWQNYYLFWQPCTLKWYMSCLRRQQPIREYHAVPVQWFSSEAFDMNEFLSSCRGHTWFSHRVIERLHTVMLLRLYLMLWSLLKNVWLSFESMSVHWCAFIFGYMASGHRWQDHVDIIYMYKRIHFQKDT